jgi:hypothetical protein
LADFADFALFIAEARIADDFFADFFVDFFAVFFIADDFFVDFADFADLVAPPRALDPPAFLPAGRRADVPLALRAAPRFFVDFDAGRLVRLGMTSPVL